MLSGEAVFGEAGACREGTWRGGAGDECRNRAA